MPNCISKPSAVSRRGMAITPALLTRTSRRSWPAAKSAANLRTDARSARSSSASSSSAPGASIWSRSTAPAPRSWSRQATTTWAPALATARAVSNPSPLLAPVTTITRPVSGGMSAVVHGAIAPDHRQSGRPRPRRNRTSNVRSGTGDGPREGRRAEVRCDPIGNRPARGGRSTGPAPRHRHRGRHLEGARVGAARGTGGHRGDRRRLRRCAPAVPTGEEYHADPEGAIRTWKGSLRHAEEDRLWPEDGPGFRADQHLWVTEFPFPGGGTLNRLCVHPSIVDFADAPFGPGTCGSTRPTPPPPTRA